MSKLRWGTDSPGDSTEARERLIEAAERCFDQFGVLKTTVEDVAAEAKVSRATVYRYFSSRDELILGVLLREGGRFLDRLDRRLNGQADLASAIVDSVVYTLAQVRGNHQLALLFTPEVSGATIAGASDALFSITSKFLSPRLQAARASGLLRPDVEPDEACEWILRTSLSFLTIAGPVHRGDTELRRYLEKFLVPALVTQDGNGRRRPSFTGATGDIAGATGHSEGVVTHDP